MGSNEQAFAECKVQSLTPSRSLLYTSPVGSFAANGYGLQDMAGNVWEWCWDWYGSHGSAAVTAPRGPSSGTRRVFRDGAWSDFAGQSRSGYRFNVIFPTYRNNFVGFRPALSLPTIITQPVSQAVNAGQDASFTVTTPGVVPISYQWRKGGVNISGGTTATLTLTNVQPADSGSYDVVVSNEVDPNLTSDPVVLDVVPTGVSATHLGISYVPNVTGGTFSILNQFSYAGPVTNLWWSVLLPAGWSFASSDASGTDIQPVAGATNLLEWRWSTLSPSPISFAFSLNLPASDIAPQAIAALVSFNYEGIPIQITAKPDPLIAGPRHSADTNHDFRLSLTELLRVIELYNTRNGTVRTGAYAVDAGNLEDGFATDPARAGTAVVTLARYHSADTNRDGKLALTELLRVIELYNFRSGTVRTGQYRVLAGTEDGFETGPAPAP